MNNPKPIRSFDTAQLKALEGAVLLGVSYHYLPYPDDARYEAATSGVDTDLAAVMLNLRDQGPMAITWAIDHDVEGLAVLSGPSYPRGGADSVIDAADRPAWHACVGERIISVAASWYVASEDGNRSLWALRLDFATGSVVIALGCLDTSLKFAPDELVVVSDSSVARSFQPRHFEHSAWGTPIE